MRQIALAIVITIGLSGCSDDDGTTKDSSVTTKDSAVTTKDGAVAVDS